MKNQKLELSWVGKNLSTKLEPRILIEDSTLSYRPEREDLDSINDNVLIKGDNLLALKALEVKYTGSIKCIFIDPPYNTGGAFEHYDDGVEHSLWLSLMKERIFALKQLLSEDGSIWISIDDNECHYLKILCDEIFGRYNFVGNIIWQKKYTIANDAKWFSDNHDHILVYAKNKDIWRPNKLPRTAEMNKAYKNPDNHPKGPWKSTPLHAKSGVNSSPYTFSNGITWAPPSGTYRRYSDDAMKKMDVEDQIWFGKKGDATPSRKTFLSELKNDGTPSRTIWTHDEVGHNHQAKEEVKKFNPSDVFGTPKPEKLLERILTLASNEGDIVLDSFSGSGTTGAVAHKMKRRWIMIELGDHCETHIIPRLRKIIDGEDQGGCSSNQEWKGGGSYKYYTLAPSLLKKDALGNWIINKSYDEKMLSEAVCKLEGFTYKPSSTEWWKHGYSTETDFIFVTKKTLSIELLEKLSEDVGSDQSLLVICAAFKAKPDRFYNLTIKKLPNALIKYCEWDHDDYSLNVNNLPSDDLDVNKSDYE